MPDIQSMTEADHDIVGHLLFTARKVAENKGLDLKGYRLVINNGPGAGQTVFHLHLHLLSRRRFSWPPG